MFDGLSRLRRSVSVHFGWDDASRSRVSLCLLPESFLCCSSGTRNDRRLRDIPNHLFAQLMSSVIARKDLKNFRRILVKVGTSVVIHSDGSVALGRIGHL